jgi:hypothetical protein
LILVIEPANPKAALKQVAEEVHAKAIESMDARTSMGT